MAKVQTRPWDPAEHLESEEDIAAYLEAASEYDDPDLMADVLDDIARSKAALGTSAKWAGPYGPIGAYIREESKKSLESYRNQPNNLREDANQEENTARGGYANRQLFELVQNSADSLAKSEGEYIWVRLTPTHLYCADNGRPIDKSGARALLFSHLSLKRGTDQIGRFGIGFKSVLGVTDTPEFFSRAGSFRFDRDWSANLLRPIAPDIERYPVLRLAEPINPWPEIETDPYLREMVHWATNVVRLPLKPGVHDSLDKQIKEFPAEFLLFVEHVGRLVLQTDEQEVARIVTLTHKDDRWILDDGGKKSTWMLERRLHKLSADAKSDSRSLDDADEVPIWWAAPVDRLNDPGTFWAFFPTLTTSLLAGILNAPWKTNEDRQNLLPGVYNDELIDAAAAMVADALPRLSTTEDPARHLDALPRRYEFGDNEHINRLRAELNSKLKDRELVPDQDGVLRKLLEVSYPPDDLPDRALQRWAAYDKRPTDWLHHRALTRNRIARLDQVYSRQTGEIVGSLPRTSIRQWLEALVEEAKSQQPALADNLDALRQRARYLSDEDIQRIEVQREQPFVEASMAAIQTAALLSQAMRGGDKLGHIVFTAKRLWAIPDPNVVRLSSTDTSDAGTLVHPQLEEDPATLRALKELGLRPATSETAFRDRASALLVHWADTQSGDDWAEFWRLAREVNLSTAAKIIRGFDNKWNNWRDMLRVRTISGSWRSLFNALLPGSIVSEDDSRDREVTIDAVHFHKPDLPLLKQLGATDAPCAEHELSQNHRRRVLRLRRNEFIQRDLPRNPHQDRLIFETDTTSGPLDVLESLSDEGKVTYTWRLLDLPGTYDRWTMSHDVGDPLPPMEFESPAIEVLRQHGRIRTDDGIHKLSDGLDDSPKNRSVQRELLSHTQAALIRETFGITVESEARVETFGEDDPIPLIDVWPGLRNYLSAATASIELIRCDRILQVDDDSAELNCIARDGSVYLSRQDDERLELELALQELKLSLSAEEVDRVLRYRTPEEIQASRAAVRQFSTDEERLLKPVGEAQLLRRLPNGLTEILESQQDGRPLTGVQVAQAAIATYHTGALREYRHALEHLAPPSQWAGRGPAVDFVRSLGFSEEWAGDRNTRRPPYIEVQGPTSLPPLHDYQRVVVGNIRELLRSKVWASDRRGMVSMPTGSGKTRVAVQAIVEAIRDDGFEGGIMWVADRDELCEQAVESWREVWASEGKQATQLRISRMWEGRPEPVHTGNLHVIVASIQTLYTRLEREVGSHNFLADFALLVFDEAHRSVAPTFTYTMRKLGFTRQRGSGEPILIGLTATPYRGRDVRETVRLVNRYSDNRLDTGAFDSDDPQEVIQELQNMQVLAKADHATIDGGRFSLTAAELAQAERNPWLPQTAEARIARDPSRTQRIIDEYRTRILNVSPDCPWPTLIFATSVEHSKVIAALLSSIEVNGRKIRARTVSADTDRGVRRRIVEEFRSGEINALVNYGIFREGFDAPKTRAIIVARPVYSPNLYFQMVGRGLRGEKNGGNDQCLILNVRDNIDNYGADLAFSDLNWLWA